MTSRSLPFTKMHGLGNDFMVINHLNTIMTPAHFNIPQLSNRFIGVGFDQLLIIEPTEQADFFCRIFNADGSEAEQCGNGLRCIARFVHENKLTTSSNFTIATRAGIFPIIVKDYDHITVTMGLPQVKEKLIDITNHTPLNTADKWQLSIISMGNPHAILKVDTTDNIAVSETGAAISANPYFPHGTNVGFMQIISPNHVRLRTFERGAGETHACGSNACAATAAGIINGWLGQQVRVEFKYGSLLIESDRQSKSIQMTGPATFVYNGIIQL